MDEDEGCGCKMCLPAIQSVLYVPLQCRLNSTSKRCESSQMGVTGDELLGFETYPFQVEMVTLSVLLWAENG